MNLSVPASYAGTLPSDRDTKELDQDHNLWFWLQQWFRWYNRDVPPPLFASVDVEQLHEMWDVVTSPGTTWISSTEPSLPVQRFADYLAGLEVVLTQECGLGSACMHVVLSFLYAQPTPTAHVFRSCSILITGTAFGDPYGDAQLCTMMGEWVDGTYYCIHGMGREGRKNTAVVLQMQRSYWPGDFQVGHSDHAATCNYVAVRDLLCPRVFHYFRPHPQTGPPTPRERLKCLDRNQHLDHCTCFNVPGNRVFSPPLCTVSNCLICPIRQSLIACTINAYTRSGLSLF